MDQGDRDDVMDDGLRDRMRRLRWRLSGAWGLPTFVLTTIAGTVVISLLPIVGQDTNIVAAFLFCGFANLVVMGIVAPWGGWWLRRRRPQLPRAIAVDRAGTALMTGLVGVLLIVGLAHHGAVVTADDTDARQLQAVRQYLQTQAPAEYVHSVGNENVWKQSDTLYRTCVPGRDPRKNLCVYVDMSGPYPALNVDRDQQPNSVVAGPDNPGRRGG